MRTACCSIRFTLCMLYFCTVVGCSQTPVRDQVEFSIDRAIQQCANNLNALMNKAWEFSKRKGGNWDYENFPQALGSETWLSLAECIPPIIREDELHLLVCPASGTNPEKGITNYRGPRKPVAVLREEDPVGCCEPGTHSDGTINVLLRSGDVITASEGDLLYRKALIFTKGR